MYKYFINFLEIKKHPKTRTYTAKIKVYKDKKYLYFNITKRTKGELLKRLLCKDYMNEWIHCQLKKGSCWFVIMWIVALIAYVGAIIFTGLVPMLFLGGFSILIKIYFPDWWEVYRECATVIIAIIGYHNWCEYKRRTTPKYTLPRNF